MAQIYMDGPMRRAMASAPHAAAGYVLVRDETTSEGQTYKGIAERGVAEFQGPPEQLLPVSFVATIASTLYSTVRSGGETPLHVRIWADISPTFYTKYKIELTVTSSAVQSGQQAWPHLALLGALLILGLVLLVAWAITAIDWSAVATGLAKGLLFVLATVVVGGVVAMKVLQKI